LTLEDDVEQVAGTTGTSSVNGIEIPEHGSGSEFFFSLSLNNNKAGKIQ
jgi:hypothetical protein